MGITKPVKYVHPKKRSIETGRAEQRSNASAEQQDVTTGFAREPEKGRKKKSVLDVSFASANHKTCTEKHVHIRLILYPPVEGQVPLYDQMIKANYPPNKVLLGILKKRFQKFEADLMAGKIEAVPNELKTSGKPVDTTRKVTAEFISCAKAVYDPFDILSERALGQRIAEGILLVAGTSDQSTN